MKLGFPASGILALIFGSMGMTQLAMSELYPNIALMGQIQASAGDPELDAASKKRVGDALAPLDELNKKATPGEPDAETWDEAGRGPAVHREPVG